MQAACAPQSHAALQQQAHPTVPNLHITEKSLDDILSRGIVNQCQQRSRLDMRAVGTTAGRGLSDVQAAFVSGRLGMHVGLGQQQVAGPRCQIQKITRNCQRDGSLPCIGFRFHWAGHAAAGRRFSQPKVYMRPTTASSTARNAHAIWMPASRELSMRRMPPSLRP